MRRAEYRRLAVWLSLYVASAAFVGITQVEAGVAAWYAPVAFGAGLLLACGLRWWPVILVAEALINILAFGHPFAIFVGIAIPGSLEALAVAYLVDQFRITLEDAESAFALLLVSFVVPLVAATAGIALLTAMGTVPALTDSWYGWWLGDAAALVTLLPAVILLARPAERRGQPLAGRLGAAEVPLVLLLTFAVVALSAVVTISNPTVRGEIRVIWAAPVLWAAVRRDLRVTAATIAALGASVFAVFERLPDTASFPERLGLQVTLVAVGLGGLSVAIAVASRRRAVVDISAANAALHESEQRYARLFQDSPMVQLLIDPFSGLIVDANTAAVAYYGYDLDRLRSMHMSEIKPGKPPELDATPGGPARARMHLVEMHRLASGDLRTVDLQTGPVELSGRPLLHAVVRDVTDEINVRRSIARLAAAVESIADAVVTTDLEGRVTSWNPAAERLYGYRRSEALGRPVDQLVGDLQLSNASLLAAVHETGVVRLGQVSRMTASGETIPVELVVTQVLDEAGNLIGLSRLAHDLRELLERQERVRRSEALLADAARIGGVGSWEADLATGVTTWSEELYRLVGRPSGEAVAAGSLLELVHPEDRAAVGAALASDAAEAPRHPLAFRLQTADGRDRAVVATWRFVSRADGQPGRIIGVVRDVTEERALEARLLQSQKMEAIGQLAGGVAHDFNNLLTAIAGFAELVRQAAAEGRSPDEDLLEIQSAVDRAKSLTSQLLTFGRRAIVRPRPVRLAAAVAELVPMLRRLIGEQILIVTELDEAAIASIDPGQLDQVLVNLVVNARDAMPGGGRVRIAVGLDAAPKAAGGGTAGNAEGAPRADDAAGIAWLEVQDHGAGMTPDLLNQIFVPFFTTKERGRGTGLGLSTVQGIVDVAGGRISVQSAVGKGSTFRIELPAAKALLAVEAAPSAQLAQAAQSAQVLFVEDEDLVRESGARILKRAGFAVVTAQDAAMGLEIALQSRPGVLVTDIVLPGGVDGISLAESLRKHWPTLPVLLVTGYTDRVPPAWADLLSKPFSAADLVVAVRRLAARAAGSSDGPSGNPPQIPPA